jgi:hypothetical protein
MLLFIDYRVNAVPLRCRDGYLKRKYLQPSAATLKNDGSDWIKPSAGH